MPQWHAHVAWEARVGNHCAKVEASNQDYKVLWGSAEVDGGESRGAAQEDQVVSSGLRPCSDQPKSVAEKAGEPHRKTKWSPVGEVGNSGTGVVFAGHVATRWSL